jgi:hypothetical protein
MNKSLQSKAIDIKGKKYVLVADRILYFNQEYPNGRIKTYLKSKSEAERVVIKAVVMPDVDNDKRVFTGYSQALWGDGYINKTSAIENCETSAIGRALAMMGIGVIDSLASVDEINKAETQSKMTMSPRQVKEISDLLEERDIYDPEDKQKIVKAIAGTEALNTSGVARLKRDIESARSDTLKKILKGEY